MMEYTDGRNSKSRGRICEKSVRVVWGQGKPYCLFEYVARGE